MQEFTLDERLKADCHFLHKTDSYTVLLNKNAEVAWFILVPHVQQTEFYLLKPARQNHLCEEINLISVFIQSKFQIDKINVATIGNVVSQMHIHVIGRRKDDAYWPDVVWGKARTKNYEVEQVEAIRKNFSDYLDSV